MLAWAAASRAWARISGAGLGRGLDGLGRGLDGLGWLSDSLSLPELYIKYNQRTNVIVLSSNTIDSNDNAYNKSMYK